MNLPLVAGFIVEGVDDHAAERAVARGGAEDAVSRKMKSAGTASDRE